MNKDIFDSMRKQMSPSPEVRAALSEKLAQPMKKRPVPWKKYGAVAACAVLMVGAFTVYQAGKPHDQPLYRTVQLHSYVTVEGGAGYATEDTSVTRDEGGIEELYTGGEGGEGGDQDMGMTPEDLAQAMLDAGYTQEEIDEYQSIGYQMTWAKWWKFVGEQQNSEGDDPFNLDDLKTFSQKELASPSGALPAPNTGDLPGGAYVGDAAVQEGAMAYDKLAPHISSHPDWYGGAYIDNTGTLVVCLVESEDPGDKSLELQILEWTGNDKVAFTSGKYSLGYLLDLQKTVCDALYYDLGLDFGCGTDEEYNRLDLHLSQVTEEALALLAELDPDDDAIYVQVGQWASTYEDVRTNSAKTEEPAVRHVMPGGVVPPVPEGDDPIAVEPRVDEDGAHYERIVS